MSVVLQRAGGAVAEAVAAVKANPLRTSLAALATASAVATIVIVVTGLEGIATYAQQIGSRTFGIDTFVITQVVPGQLSRRELADRLARNPPIRPADHRFLERVADNDVIYAPVAQRAGDIAAGSLRFEDAAINGTSEMLAEIRSIELDEGRFFTASDTTRAAQVVVVGADIADTLFPVSSAVGQSVRIAGRRFLVVGVQTRQGTAGGVTLDRYVYMPLGALDRAFEPSPTLQIFARSPGADAGSRAEDRAYASMRARRQLRPGEADTFDLLTPESARSFVLTLATRIGAAALPISIMALITAMVVVTNTALVSVTQRMREIGVRRAVGAPRATILAEVMAESLVTACVGGASGLGIAVAALAAAGRLTGLPLTPEWTTLAGAFLAAALTGLVAGYYPARQASAVDVIAALRLE